MPSETLEFHHARNEGSLNTLEDAQKDGLAWGHGHGPRSVSFPTHYRFLKILPTKHTTFKEALVNSFCHSYNQRNLQLPMNSSHHKVVSTFSLNWHNLTRSKYKNRRRHRRRNHEIRFLTGLLKHEKRVPPPQLVPLTACLWGPLAWAVLRGPQPVLQGGCHGGTSLWA